MRPLKLSQKPFCIGFPGAMKCQTSLLSCAQANRAFEVNSVPLSETIMPGLPRRSINAVSSGATRRPEIEVSGIAARHSRVTVDDVEDPKSPAAGQLVVDEIQRPAGVRGRLDGDRRPRSQCAPPSPSLAHREALFAGEPVDAVDPGRFAVLAQQDKQSPIAEALPFVGEIAQLCPKLCIRRSA